MSATSSQLGYIQTRLQARHGQRPTEENWRLLEATPDLAAYLQAARRTTLAPWIAHMPAEVDTHRIERSLREDWVDFVAEISGWAPDGWQPAIDWFVTTPYLPYMAHLTRGEPVSAWMRDDPALSPYAAEDAASRATGLTESLLAPTLGAIKAGRPPLAAWMEQWLTLVPADAIVDRTRLEQMAAGMVNHFQNVAMQPTKATRAQIYRQSMIDGLVRRFRRYARTPVAIFAYLGMAQIDFERLRGGLVLRALFPDTAGRPQWA